MAAALGPMIVLTNNTPDRIPADVIMEEHEHTLEAQKKGEDLPNGA